MPGKMQYLTLKTNLHNSSLERQYRLIVFSLRKVRTALKDDEKAYDGLVISLDDMVILVKIFLIVTKIGS